MCFSKPKEPYNSYKTGDFARWQASFDKKSAIQQKQAKGEITAEEAAAQIAALGDLSGLENKIKEDASGGMEMRERVRQGDIGLGRIGIDKAFNQFDDNYYKDYQKDYTDFYFPELDRQYGEVVDKTVAALAGRGMLESTVGGGKLGDLQREQGMARTNITNEGVDASNKLKGQVQNAKSSLYSLNEASANPQAVNAQAVGQATALVAPPSYSPLGQVFASALNSLANYQGARNNAPGRSYASPYANPTGYGSGSVVR